jgi:hypothetical protein
MSWKFWKREEDPPATPDPAAIYAEVVAEVQAAGLNAPASLLNRAGTLAATQGDQASALRYHGRAIDGYLENQQYEAAAAVGRMMLRYAPDTVRVRCTLAFLSLGRSLDLDAIEELTGYVDSVRRTGQATLGVARLALMVEIAEDTAVRERLADALQELGAPADLVERARESLGRTRSEEERWRRIIHAVSLRPADLWAGEWKSQAAE